MPPQAPPHCDQQPPHCSEHATLTLRGQVCRTDDICTLVAIRPLVAINSTLPLSLQFTTEQHGHSLHTQHPQIMCIWTARMGQLPSHARMAVWVLVLPMQLSRCCLCQCIMRSQLVPLQLLLFSRVGAVAVHVS